MSRLSKLRTDIQNTNQANQMTVILEDNYPKTMKTVGIFSRILMLPLYLTIWSLMALGWFIQTVDDGIDWVVDNIEETIHLFNTAITILVFKTILKSKERNKDE